MLEMKPLACMKDHYDGAHWGLADWYPAIEEGIKKALAKGPKARWTTGWYSSKKEIASCCITSEGDSLLHIEVSVTDDFDTPGIGEKLITFQNDLTYLQNAICETWDLAEEDRKQNQSYAGFSILKNGAWVDTYLVDISGEDLDSPPGDECYKWGFQNEDEDAEKISAPTKKKIVKCISDHLLEKIKEKEYTVGKYTVRPWGNE